MSRGPREARVDVLRGNVPERIAVETRNVHVVHETRQKRDREDKSWSEETRVSQTETSRYKWNILEFLIMFLD